MTNAIQIFNNEAFGQVRIIMQNNEPWFVAKDVCDVLGFSDTNAGTRHLDNDEKMSVILTGISATNPVATIINESGLYSLILRSRKPEAKKFKKWVTSEVLPSIRKRGGYLTSEAAEQALLDPDFIIRLATELKEERALKEEAIRTKAWISDKKTATAMATASAAQRKLRKVEAELGRQKEYKTARATPWLGEYLNLKCRGTWISLGTHLRKLSQVLGYEIVKIEDSAWGQVNTYHVDVIDELRAFLMNEPYFMEQYRV